MKIAVFSSKVYDKKYFDTENIKHHHDLIFFQDHLNQLTTNLTRGFDAVCVFVNDKINRDVISDLANNGVKYIALRCTGFDNIDLEACHDFNIMVCRVPAYSPYAVAEHTAALMLSLNRKIFKAFNRIREGNFELDGLMGFDIHGKTVGIIGTGKIGAVFAKIMHGFGCKLLFNDPYENAECVKIGQYTQLNTLYENSDIISLHCPLTADSHHMINEESVNKMKEKVMLLNTSRGGLIDARALIKGLKDSRIGSIGLDVYEKEEEFFFEDCSDITIKDDIFMRLTTFPNVLITGHQAFFTSTALANISSCTLQNLSDLEAGRKCSNLVNGEGSKRVDSTQF